MSFGSLYLGPLVGEFMSIHANLKIELTFNDRFIDPIEEGIDVTVRIGILADSNSSLGGWRLRAACLSQRRAT